MNFAYLNDRDELFFHPLNETSELYFPVQAMEGARYIITESNDADINNNISLERVNNDLTLTLYSASPTASVIVINDFYQTNAKLLSLSANGQVEQHAAAADNPAQGAVALANEALGAQQDQPEAAPLKALQHAATLQSLEKLAASLEVTSDSQSDPAPVAQPLSAVSLQDEIIVKPSITTMEDHVGTKQGNLISGSVTDDKLPLIQGTGQPGTTLEFFLNGDAVGFIDVDAQGQWSFTFDEPLTEGGQLFYVRDTATDQKSSYMVLIVDTVAPAQTQLLSVVADNTGEPVNLAKNDYTGDNTPTFSGKGEANCLIAIYNDKTLIGTTYADNNGNWTLALQYALPDGPYAARAVAIDSSGNTGLSSPKFNFVIDTVPPAQPQILSIIDDVGPATGPVLNGAGTDDNTPTLNGRAEAGSTVTLFDNGVQIGQVQADAAGNWSFTPGDELDSGSHTFTVTATDRVGNVSTESQPWTIQILPGMPDAPEVEAVYDDRGENAQLVASGEPTGDATPVITGSAEANSTVIVYENGEEIARVTTDENGHWRYSPETPFDDGEHSLTFVTLNPAGNQSEPSDPWVVVVDTTAPDAPVIGSITDDVGALQGPLNNGDSTDDTRPTLNGTAEAGTVVAIYDNGQKLGETTADEDGNWSFTPETDLSEGEHSLTVTATDAVGNTSEPSAPWALVIDTTAPDQPGIDGEGDGISGMTDDKGPITGPIENGGTTDDDTPTLNGKGEPGDTVIVLDNGDKIGEVVVDEDGNWTFTPETGLGDGEHEISVIIQDPAGNQSEPSDPWVVTVDTTAPDAPVIGSITDDVGAIQGPLNNGDSTDDTRPTLNGTAEAGAVVAIYDNGQKLGETTAYEDGSWSFTPETGLTEGEHSLTVTATDAVGNTSEPSDPWALVIDTTAPEQPGIDGEGDGISGMTDDKGPITGPIENGGSTDDDTPTLNGKGQPGDTVIVLDNGEKIGETTVDEDGNWTFTPETALEDGEHEISVIIQDPAGNQSEPSDPWVVVVDTTAPDVPVIGSITDDVGALQGPLNNGDSTDDTRPTLNGTAEAGTVVAIYDNGQKLGETTADEDGNWSFTPETDLSEGEHSLTVTATDAVGNTSEPSDPWALVIDTTAPEQPGIDGEGDGISGMTDDKGPITGPIENGGSTDDDTPTLNGKGQPGDTVIVLDNGDKIGETTVDEDGTWTFTPETALEDGEHEISVIIQDPAGNQSEPSDPWVVTVDTTAPDVPVIGSITDDVGALQGPLNNGDSTDDTCPTLNGTAETGAVVAIYDNGQKLGETTADEDGNWSFTPETDLSEGEHSLTVTATDAVGNTSESSAPWELVIDTTAPEQPGIDGEGDGISGMTDDKGPITGPIENGGSTDDDTPTLNGKGQPGDTVIVLDNGDKIGETTVDEDGTWTFTPETGLGDGEHEISVVIQDPAGNQSEPSEPWVVTVDTTAPDAPVIGSITDDVGAIQGPLNNGDSTDDTRPTLNGTAEAGAVVTIYDNGQKLGETTADAEGNWSFTPETDLAGGTHSFTADAQDSVGNTSDISEPWNTRVVVKLPDAPTIDAVLDDIGPQTGELKSGDVTDDRRPEIKGTSEPGETVIVYDRGIEIGRATADEDGRWSVTPAADLNDGIYRFTAVVEDDAGNVSPASDAFEVVIYSGEGPTQIARLSHMGKDSGFDGNDFVTDNGDAGRLMYGTLSAQLTAGQTLQVSTDGGRSWINAMVEGTQWAAQDLNDHVVGWNIQTRVLDGAGNAGFVMQQAVTLDTTAPRAPGTVHLEGTNLVVDFANTGVMAGDRVSIVTGGGAQRFEHTLSEQDIAAGSVSIEVGEVGTASAALIDKAGNLSGFTSTSGSAPSVNMEVTGDVSEIYGQGRDNVFTVTDVNTLDAVKVIEGNGGVDTLKLTGADQVLDLSSWQGRLSSVEVIDITGTGNNTLKLSLGDILDQGHQGAFISDDSVQMAVKGNAGDVVMLSDLLPNGMDVGDWENLGEVVAAGVSYDVYHHSELGAELLIQQGVTVQFS